MKPIGPWLNRSIPLATNRIGMDQTSFRMTGSHMDMEKTIKAKVLGYLGVRPSEVAFLRSEFNVLARSRSGVDKALRTLVKEGRLVRCGYGVLVRGKYNDLAGQVTPVTWPERYVPEVLRKLGVSPKPNSVLREYNERQTTQVPVWLAYEVGSSRIQRKIGFGKRIVYYERNGKVSQSIRRQNLPTRT